MASIEKRGSVWRVRVTRKGFRRESATFTRKAEALAWANKRETEINAGRRGQIIPHTVKEALERYRDTVAPTHRGEQWERVRLNKFARDLPFRHRLLTEVAPDDIAGWRDLALAGRGRQAPLAPASVRREMGLLRLVFEACRREWRWLRENPMDGVKRPLGGPARNRLFSDAETTAIINRLGEGSKVALALRFALETGLRAGEICGLTWADVNAPLAFLILPRTKNGDARDVPLSRAALGVLARLSEPSSLLLRSLPYPVSGFVSRAVGAKCSNAGFLPTHSVFGLSTGVLDTLFRRARDAEGIKGLHFHDSRATAITRLSAKLDILELARMVGRDCVLD